LRFYPCQNLL